MRSFASDNNSGVHPEVINAIIKANENHAIAYGDDPWSEQATELIKQEFGPTAYPLFVFNGTGANAIALRATTRSYHSILCAASAHIAVDECGAPTQMTGCVLKELTTPNGKLTPALIATQLHGFGFEHHSQPRVIYISQCSEFGTVYTQEEIKAIAKLVHANGMYLHMDGARLANAAVALQCTLQELTVGCGVDILSFGGTKNGLMMGESVVSFRPELNEELKYLRKQSAQLYSKMRYTACQFIPYLKQRLWYDNAAHANRMAQRLRQGIESFDLFEFTQPTEANTLLLKMPADLIQKLQERYFFYVWDESTNEIRLVTSWDTSEEDISDFLNTLKTFIG